MLITETTSGFTVSQLYDKNWRMGYLYKYSHTHIHNHKNVGGMYLVNLVTTLLLKHKL